MSVLDRPPRSPAEYTETEHYTDDILPDPMRFLTRELADRCIADGRDYPDEGGPNKTRRKLEVEGVDVVLVIADDAPVLVTGWTEVADWARALASDRWTMPQLRKMRAFKDREHKRGRR